VFIFLFKQIYFIHYLIEKIKFKIIHYEKLLYIVDQMFLMYLYIGIIFYHLDVIMSSLKVKTFSREGAEFLE
jgi:hypothetical protein